MLNWADADVHSLKTAITGMKTFSFLSSVISSNPKWVDNVRGNAEVEVRAKTLHKQRTSFKF